MKKIILLVFVLANIVSYVTAQSHWVQTATPPYGTVWDLAVIGTNVFAGGHDGVYLTTDSGATWTLRNGAFPTMGVRKLVANDSIIVIVTDNGMGDSICKSSDYGLSWTNVTPSFITISAVIEALAINGTDVYAGNRSGSMGIYKSSLSGISTGSWTLFNNGLVSLPNMDISSLAIKDDSMYAGNTNHGIWVSPVAAANWSITNGIAFPPSNYIGSMSFHNSNAVAGSFASTGHFLYRSTDNGANWMPLDTTFTDNHPVFAVINDGNKFYAGTVGRGVFMSSDTGTTWMTYNDGFQDSLGTWSYYPAINVRSLAICGTTMFAGTDNGVWKRSIATTVIPTEIKEVNLSEHFSIYPNPASDNITVKVSNELAGSVYSIADELGRIVLKGKIMNETLTINIHELNSGVYILNVGTIKSYKAIVIKQ